MRQSERTQRFSLSEATAFLEKEKRPLAVSYQRVLPKTPYFNSGIRDSLLRALDAHVRAPDHTLSTAQINQNASWKGGRGSGGVGLHYGTLGRQVAKKLDILERPITFIRRGRSQPGVRVQDIKTTAIAAEHWRVEKDKNVLYWMLYPEVVEALRALGIGSGDTIEPSQPPPRPTRPGRKTPPKVTDPIDAVEGEKRITSHIQYERSLKFTQGAKQRYATRNQGRLPCEICGFDFEEEYGTTLGGSFIEAHHIVPLSAGKTRKNTSDNDLMMLCRNCHFMIHKLLATKDEVSRKQAMRILKAKPKS